jgi:hypothetical protein
MHDAIFRDGPVADRKLTVRSDLGVLVVDAQASLAWLYVSNDGGSYYDLKIDENSDPVTGARQLDENLAIQAAEQGYDVMAVPGNDPGQPDPGEGDPGGGEGGGEGEVPTDGQ